MKRYELAHEELLNDENQIDLLEGGTFVAQAVRDSAAGEPFYVAEGSLREPSGEEYEAQWCWAILTWRFRQVDSASLPQFAEAWVLGISSEEFEAHGEEIEEEVNNLVDLPIVWLPGDAGPRLGIVEKWPNRIDWVRTFETLRQLWRYVEHH
jgi:hypothetical protein